MVSWTSNFKTSFDNIEQCRFHLVCEHDCSAVRLHRGRTEGCGLFVVGGVIESGQNLHLPAQCGYNVFSVECVNGLKCPRMVDECDQCRAFKMTIHPHPLMTTGTVKSHSSHWHDSSRNKGHRSRIINVLRSKGGKLKSHKTNRKRKWMNGHLRVDTF